MTPKIQPFHAMLVGRAAFEMQERGESVIHMEYGQPSAPPPQPVRDAAAAMLENQVKGYWESADLKRAIGETYRSLYGVEVSSDRIVLTCGASPALALALMTCFSPGDRIAMGRPGYVAHRNCVAGLHMEAVELPCGIDTGFQLTAAMVDALDPVPDGLIVASPANPTGSIIPYDEMKKIVDVCNRKDIQIISDEIYNRITYGARAASICEFTDQACLINSFSKFYAMPGWRLGWAVLPERLAARGHAYMSNFYLTPPSLSQVAGYAATECTDDLTALIDVYRTNRALLLDALPGMGLEEMAPPDGAFYVYARVDHLTDDSRELCLALLRDTGVATASGVDFDPEVGHRYMRFSFAVTTPEIEDAISRMRPWFGKS